jgi:hypothetical protein
VATPLGNPKREHRPESMHRPSHRARLAPLRPDALRRRRAGRGRSLRTRRPELDGGRLGSVRAVRTDQPMLCQKGRATVFLRGSDPAAGLTGNLPLGRLHRSPGARRLARRAIVLLELAQCPAQRGPFPASSANGTRRNAGIVECQFGLLSTFRASPGHPADSTGGEEALALPRATCTGLTTSAARCC